MKRQGGEPMTHPHDTPPTPDAPALARALIPAWKSQVAFFPMLFVVLLAYALGFGVGKLDSADHATLPATQPSLAR